MSVHYVGTQTTFSHHEFDASNGALPPQLGTWISTNPSVATIDQAGVASWLAAGDTDIVFSIPSMARFATHPVTVHSAIPVSLTATPDTVHLTPNSVERVTVTALDSDGDPIPDLELDSIISTDEAVATIIQLEKVPGQPPQFLMLGVAVGGCIITIEAGPSSANVNADVLEDFSQSDADARYRRLSIVVPAGDVQKDQPMIHAPMSGSFDLHWTPATRAHQFKMNGDLTVHLFDLPQWEYAFLDVMQDGVGGHIFRLVLDAALPPIAWDTSIEPDETPDLNTRDSYMVYREIARTLAARTWQKVAT